jgi:hypothetical protein
MGGRNSSPFTKREERSLMFLVEDMEEYKEEGLLWILVRHTNEEGKIFYFETNHRGGTEFKKERICSTMGLTEMFGTSEEKENLEKMKTEIFEFLTEQCPTTRLMLLF